MIFDAKSVEDAGYQISYTSPTGELWTLHTADRAFNKHRRVALLKEGFIGGIAEPDFKELETVNRFGSRTVGVKFPAFDGELRVVVRDEPGRMPFTFRNWRRSWRFDQDGVITVVARDGGNYWTRARLTSVDPPPHELKARPAVEDAVKWRSLDGCWFGYRREFTGTVKVDVPGDFVASCKLKWDASVSTSATLPNGQVINLTAGSGGTRFIDLDRGMMGHVTDQDGNTDSALWSSMRGTVFGYDLQPHTMTTWTLGPGLELQVTPRFATPWGG